MAKKDRTLYVLKYLWKNTDEDHPATVSDILAALENENIKVERHALMSDIEQLTEFGIDIVCVKSSPNRHFIGQRSFELPELKLLVDAVESSRFISASQSSSLVSKLYDMASLHQASELNRHLYVDGRVKSDSRTLYYSAICRALKAAMNENAEALALIKANLAYAVTGDEANLNLGAIEKRIKEATKEMENYMASYRNTGGDKNRYLECIQSAADEIKALRVQLETAKSKLEKCDEANAEIRRLCDWLYSHDTSFSEYDDMVIRRVVECIKVFKDGTIKVITKFGTEATETV